MISQLASTILKSAMGARELNHLRVGIKHRGLLLNYISSRQETTIQYTPPCPQFTTIAKIFNSVSKKKFGGCNKISVVGLDEVGVATVFSLLNQNVTDNICMIDLDEDVMKGELMDLTSGALFHNNANIISSKDPAATADSKICIIITGTYKGRDEHPTTYIGRNVGIIKALIPPLVKYSPTTILIIASDPVDILSYVTWKLSGLPKNRIIGTGTLLDTARFRYTLSQRTGISPSDCHGYIIGEHGETSVPVWSGVNIAGVPIKDINLKVGDKTDAESWSEIHKEVVKCDETVRNLKGYSAWSFALAITSLCKAICNNSNTVMPVSTHVLGEHSIRDDVYLSLPCVIGDNGVTDIVRQTLSGTEMDLLRQCAENVASLQQPATKLLT